jgi:hypothetical protein
MLTSEIETITQELSSMQKDGEPEKYPIAMLPGEIVGAANFLDREVHEDGTLGLATKVMID